MALQHAVRQFRHMLLNAHATRSWDETTARAQIEAIAAHFRTYPRPERVRHTCEAFNVRAATAGTFYGSHRGRLSTMDGGFQAEVAPYLAEEQRDFVLLHECAHTLFFSPDSQPSRLVPVGSEAEETLCDAFATAVLAP